MTGFLNENTLNLMANWYNHEILPWGRIIGGCYLCLILSPLEWVWQVTYDIEAGSDKNAFPVLKLRDRTFPRPHFPGGDFSKAEKNQRLVPLIFLIEIKWNAMVKWYNHEIIPFQHIVEVGPAFSCVWNAGSIHQWRGAGLFPGPYFCVFSAPEILGGEEERT